MGRDAFVVRAKAIAQIGVSLLVLFGCYAVIRDPVASPIAENSAWALAGVVTGYWLR